MERPLGLRLQLLKDPPPKYTGAKRSERAMRDTWRVFGQFDLLVASPLYMISEASDYLPITQRSSGSSLNLLLFPFSIISSSSVGCDESETSIYQELSNPTGANAAPFAYVLFATLSPAAYEGLPDYQSIFRAIEAVNGFARVKLAEHQIDRFAICLSLSSPDFVVICLPRDEAEFSRCKLFTRTISNYTMAELVAASNTFDRSIEYDGHAFARVEDVAAMNGEANADEYFESTREGESDFSIEARIRCECGHEDAVVTFIDSLLQTEYETSKAQDQTQITAVDYSSATVTVKLESFHQYRWVWRRISEDRFCVGNIYGFETRILPNRFSERRRADLHKSVWRFCDKLEKQLRFAEETIHQSGDLMGTYQHTRLKELFATYRDVLQSPEAATVAKELLPALLQFAALLKHRESLIRHLSDALNVDTFRDDVAKFNACFENALIARTEERQRVGESAILKRLPNGTTSVLSCYTAVFYLCWELLTRVPDRSPPLPQNGECLAESFSGLVVAGQQGRVTNSELFEVFRRSLEAEIGNRIDSRFGLVTKLSGDTHRVEWTSRICVFEISGGVLLRSDEAFVQALHEVAELSQWSSLDQNKEVRQVLNLWTMLITTKVIDSIAKEKAEALGLENVYREGNEEFPVAMISLILASYLDPGIEDLGDKCDPELINLTVSSARASHSPRDFCYLLNDAFVKVKGRDRIARHVEKVMYSPKEPAHFMNYLSVQALSENFDQIQSQLEHWGGIVVEVCSDIAMWSMVRMILLEDAFDFESQINHLNRVYRGIFLQAKESTGAVMEAGSGVIIRWSVLLGALMMRAGQWSKDGLLSTIRRELEMLTESQRGGKRPTEICYHLSPLLATLESLSAAISVLTPFGGQKEVFIADLKTQFSSAEIALVEEFRRAWKAGNDAARVRLAFHFWAKSQRLAHHRMMVRDFGA